MAGRRIALATCRALPEPDPDERPLIEALEAAGHRAEAWPWDGPGPGPEAFDAVVLRATWNYFEQPARFQAWLRTVAAATRLLNPLPIARWNLRKTYLADLAERGVPVVPTTWLPAGTVRRYARLPPPSAPQSRGAPTASPAPSTAHGDQVLKPVMGAGSHLTRRFGPDEAEAAQRFLDAHPELDFMQQPFLRRVEAEGEPSVVAIDGELSHAVLKHPRFDGDEERVERIPLTDRLVAFAERVLAAAPKGWLYARVDAMADDEGALVLSELELLEPSLFFELGGPEALDRMVRGIERRS